MVFAKTAFAGVVQASYVRLNIVGITAPEKVYSLYIGDKMRQQNFPWVEGVVGTEYFFIELPEGEYRIDSIIIPVGTVLAEEPMDITFKVEPYAATYIGDLSVRGTRERVRVGGLPVIQPGFEYEADVEDNFKAALLEFRSKLPRYSGPIRSGLMKVHEPRNFEIKKVF